MRGRQLLFVDEHLIAGGLQHLPTWKLMRKGQLIASSMHRRFLFECFWSCRMQALRSRHISGRFGRDCLLSVHAGQLLPRGQWRSPSMRGWDVWKREWAGGLYRLHTVPCGGVLLYRFHTALVLFPWHVCSSKQEYAVHALPGTDIPG